MFDLLEFKKSKKLLSHLAGKNYYSELNQHHLTTRPAKLLDWIEFLKEELGFFTLQEITASDLDEQRFELVYHLLNMGNHQRLNLHLQLEKDEVIPSIVDYFANADWPEREQREMFNLKFNMEKEPLFLAKNQQVFPLLKKTGSAKWPAEDKPSLPKLRFNPNKSQAPYPEENYLWKDYDLLSPLHNGDFECMACFDPLEVVDIRVRVGFHFSGMEKNLEEKNIIQINCLVDKLNLSSAPTYSIAWTKTIEEMLSIKISERSQALRIILLELARINDHLTTLALICREAQYDEFRLYIDIREKFYELMEMLTGHRRGLVCCEIGGLRSDIPIGWTSDYQAISSTMSKTLALIHKTLISRRKFRNLLEGPSLDSQEVMRWGLGGPAMRAAGLNFDLRKSQPFYFYQDIDFDIPVGIHGTTFDRFLIRHEEIFQSFRIINQLIDNLPLGEINNPSLKNDLLANNENTFKLNGWYYSSLESPGGEAGFLVKFFDSWCPERIKIKTPSFALTQALPVLVRGLSEKQLSLALVSLGISRWELDR